MKPCDEITKQRDHAEATLSEELEGHPSRLALRDRDRVQSDEEELD
jgi:hypothetical protein